MNCQEFKTMTERSPFDCTREERLAWKEHKNTCPYCKSWTPSGPMPAIVEVMKPIIKELARRDVEGQK